MLGAAIVDLDRHGGDERKDEGDRGRLHALIVSCPGVW
jgi:hypothetical protein